MFSPRSQRYSGHTKIEDLSAFTGLSIEEFNRLYPMIADRYGDYEKKRRSR